MKKIFSIILVLLLVLGTFVGCSSKGESVDKIKEALDKVVEEALKEDIVGDVSKDSKLPKLTVTQLPLDMVYDEERIVDEHILINSHKVSKDELKTGHGMLMNVRKNNGVFILGELNDIPAIVWNDGEKSRAKMFAYDYSDKQVILDNGNLTKLEENKYGDYEYWVFRTAVVDTDVDDYSIMIDFGCDKYVALIDFDFWHEEWGFTTEKECDDMALQFAKELLPVLDVHCSCCHK